MIPAWTGDVVSRGQARGLTDGHIHSQTDAGNDNTRRPKLAGGKNDDIRNIHTHIICLSWCKIDYFGGIVERQNTYRHVLRILSKIYSIHNMNSTPFVINQTCVYLGSLGNISLVDSGGKLQLKTNLIFDILPILSRISLHDIHL